MRAAQIGLVSLGLAFIIGCGVPVAVAEGAGGDVIWQDRFDGPAHLEDLAGAITTNACVIHGDAVFVAGFTTVAQGNTGRLVRAYESGTGRLLWEDRHVASDRRDLPAAIAAEGNGVFTAGATIDGNGASRGLVRAYDRRNGRVLWEDITHPTDYYGQWRVTVRNGRVFVAGAAKVKIGSSSQFDYVLRAYDARTGTLLWQDLHGAGGFNEQPMAITTDGRRVFVVERSWDRTLFRMHSAIRAYEQRTGAVLWQDRLAPSDGQVGVWQVAVAGSRVFVSGHVSSPVVEEGALLRAYDVDTGDMLWETVRSVAGDMSTYAAASLAAWQNRVVTAGAVYNTSWNDADLLVGAYDATTGRLLWEDRVDVGNTDEALAVDVSSSGVFVTGWVGSGMADDVPNLITTDFFVRAYDVQSGHVRWTDRVEGGVIDGRLDGGLAIAAQGDRVFAAGLVDTPIGDGSNRDFFVRAYEAR